MVHSLFKCYGTELPAMMCGTEQECND